MPASQRLPDDGAIEEDQSQYHQNQASEQELSEKYPNRPHNHSRTLFFGDLLTDLFNPLNENKKRPTGPKVSRAKVGPHGPGVKSAHEVRRSIIERFISKWRKDVGDDFYPALRLILPEKDRDRLMYGLKEKGIGKIIVRMLSIAKGSDDASDVLNWKLPAKNTSTQMAGDFAGRCHELLKGRAMVNGKGDMRIAEVNELLDELSKEGKEDAQLKIFDKFYHRMSADEMMWLIRIILRQMKIGASEKTILELWHPNAEALFNVCSSLRRVCWELTDPESILDSENTGVELMACFQPQLAQFQQHNFQKMVDKMGMPVEKPAFWIEEKLDGERMQMHMVEDDSHPGGKRFGFWSRKGKDYTYLYGSGYEDDNSALTRHIKDAFDPRLRNIILDGEMITWDPDTDKIVPFGTLKSAAISEQKNPFQTSGQRPLFRVFDCLYLNERDITRYTLRDRRQALEKVLTNVHRRFELHHYEEVTEAQAIEPALRQVVAEASEGLVLKNPESRYLLSMRDNVWMKVKPEYMMDFGESLDCIVVGGYYGSGRRGGGLSSFLCGLRIDQNHIEAGANPMKCFSFFKVGGGFRAEDYATIRNMTEGKWVDWDRDRPPTEYIELAGGDLQKERPDMWIKPCDSVVLEVKAASVGPSESFKTNYTLRFPRFKRLREDKDWQSALSLSEFALLKTKVEAESSQRDFVVQAKRKINKRIKKEVVIAGTDSKIKTPYAGPQTKVFEGLDFHVMTDMLLPFKKSKAELEETIKANGGSIYASPTAKEHIICLAEKRPVKVASIIKRGETNIVRPAWLFDAIKQSEIDGPQRSRFLIPFESTHMFHLIEGSRGDIEGNVDVYGDSYCRDITPKQLGKMCEGMVFPKHSGFDAKMFRLQLEERGRGLEEGMGNMFARHTVRFVMSETTKSDADIDVLIDKTRVSFAGGKIAESDGADGITHFVIVDQGNKEGISALRIKISGRRPVPRVVSLKWVQDSWREKTVLDEERYAV